MAKVRLNGDSSGFIELAAPNAAGSNTLTLPTSNGSANQLLKNSGTAGALAWSTLTEDSSGNLNVDSGTFFVDATNNRVGIGTTTPGTALDVSGAISLSNVALPSAGTARIFSRNTDSNLYIQTGSGSTINLLDASQNTMAIFEPTSVRFQISNSEKARLDSSGRLLVGTSSTAATIRAVFAGGDGGGSVGSVQIANTGNSLTDGQGLGTLGFVDSDHSSGKQDYARITGARDGGTWSSTSKPTRLVFSTTADGASSPTERMRITSGGQIKTSAASNTTIFYTNAEGSAGTGFSFYFARSGNDTDTEFNLRGDGTALADGSWIGGGADYAEYFEWSDSNPDEEDRRGISVVLDGDKIREAVADEDPIGVISGNPSVVGDAAWNKWNGKHLRDEFGTYLLDENGERQLNPAYDPDQEYIPREQRPEWDRVGLMGKLRIRKGQVIGSRWIKMRDISDTVEEWLVR